MEFDDMINENKISFGWPNEVGPVPAQKFAPLHTNIETISATPDDTNKMQHEPFQSHENALIVTDG